MKQVKAKSKKTPLVLIGACGLFLSGCMVGPDFKGTDYKESEEWIGKHTEASSSIKTQQWWLQFNEPALNDIMSKALVNNFDIHTAGLRILEARAALGITTGNLFPQVQQMNASVTENRLSKNRANSSPTMDRYYGAGSASFDMAWEMDFWGRFRRAVEAGEADLALIEADYDNVMVTLTSEVARYYIYYRGDYARLQVAKRNAEIQQKSLDLVDARFKAGEVTELDVLQAKTLLYTTEATIPRLQLSVKQWTNALAFLAGLLPGDLDSILAGDKPPVDVAKYKLKSIPREAIRRRPDIRKAELALMAQSARIGVAKAELYPHFSLVGSIGLVSSNASVTNDGGSNLGDIWKGDSVEYFGGPSVSWNILNYGRIKNNVRIQDARYQQLAVQYKKIIQTALKEADDSLVGVQRHQEALGFVFDSVKASNRATELALFQYKEGLVDFQRVIDAMEVQLQNEDAYIVEKGAVALNLAGFYKAVGGGWEVKPGKEIIPAAMAEEMAERTDWGDLIEEDNSKPAKIEINNEREKADATN